MAFTLTLKAVRDRNTAMGRIIQQCSPQGGKKI